MKGLRPFIYTRMAPSLPCPVPMPPAFRLLTANLLSESCDVSAFDALVTRFSPDVVVIQELAHEAAEMLESHFPRHHYFPSVDLTGRGIFTRFDAEFGDLDMPRRSGSWARLEVGDRSLWVAGVHFLNPINFPWWVSARARRHQLEALFEWMDPVSGPLAVAGDFNASPAWPVYKAMAGRLRDVIAAHAESRGEKPERTWGWRPGWPRMLRIDHVFARGLAATAVFVEPVEGSDHFALIADLELTGDGQTPATGSHEAASGARRRP